MSHQHLLNQHFKVHARDPDNTEQPHVTFQEQDKPDGTDEADDDDGNDIAFSVVENNGVRQRVYHCSRCPTSSKRKTYIVVHEQMHDMNASESFKCSKCGFTTQNDKLYLNHMAKHEAQRKQVLATKAPAKPAAVPSAPTKRTFDGLSKQQQPAATISPSSTVVDSASLKFGNRRMFSYVCRSCPAAFKSPGDLKIHTVFHGDVDYAHCCPYCNYKAKNKPQLQKHLYVHTAEYISKRANSYPDGTKLTISEGLSSAMSKTLAQKNMQKPARGTFIPAPPPLYVPNQVRKPAPTSLLEQKLLEAQDDVENYDDVDDYNQATGELDQDDDGFPDDLTEPQSAKRSAMAAKVRFQVEQLCLLESNETKEFLLKLRKRAKHRFIHRCPACPAAFLKANTLKFHSSLHGYGGRLRCRNCSYAVDYEQNLNLHQLLHANSVLATSATAYTYNHRCTKCPAAFSKPARLEKHITLHGSNAKWKCDKVSCSCLVCVRSSQ